MKQYVELSCIKGIIDFSGKEEWGNCNTEEEMLFGTMSEGNFLKKFFPVHALWRK